MKGSVRALNNVSEIESVEISLTKYSVFRNFFGTIPCFFMITIQPTEKFSLTTYIC